MKKADTGFLTPAGHAPARSEGPTRGATCLSRPPPEEPSGRVHEQVTLFTAFLIGKVPGLVFRLEIKIIARVMNLML